VGGFEYFFVQKQNSAVKVPAHVTGNVLRLTPWASAYSVKVDSLAEMDEPTLSSLEILLLRALLISCRHKFAHLRMPPQLLGMS